MVITPEQQTTFFASMRKEFFNGKLSQQQVDGTQAILNEWNRIGTLEDKRHLAYMLATTYHETAKTMFPIEEYGRGKNKPYGKKLQYGMGPGKRIAYSHPDVLYFGRGYVQLTWYENYYKMSKLIKVDIFNHPELALVPEVAAKIMFEGMLTANSYRGDFTGYSLEQFFNMRSDNPKGARAIINGEDCNELIAGYHHRFLKCLSF